jgi:hypothetical protein
MSPSRRSPLAIGAAAVALVALALVWRWERNAPRPPTQATARSTPTDVPAADASRARARTPTADAGGTADAPPSRGPGGPGPDEPEDMETPWSVVDLDALRKELPDNLYWKMASPTSDPAIVEAREQERERWNVEYGKVLSNTATADEVDAYYAYRYKLASDYVQFATFLLADYGDDLTPRDVGLLKVAIELNLARLEEIPRDIAEAHERRKAHEAAREAWLESERAFKNVEK